MNLFPEPKVGAACPACGFDVATPLAAGIRSAWGSGGVQDRKDGGLRACLKCGQRYVVTSRGVWRAPVFSLGAAAPTTSAPAPPQKRAHGDREPIEFPAVHRDIDLRETKA